MVLKSLKLSFSNNILVYKHCAVHRLKPYGPHGPYVAPQMMVHYTCNCIGKDTRQALGWVT